MQKGQVPVYECSETKQLYIGIGLVIIPEYIGTGLVMTLSEIDWHRVGNDTKWNRLAQGWSRLVIFTFTCAWAQRTTSFLERASFPLRHWMARSASWGRGECTGHRSQVTLQHFRPPPPSSSSSSSSSYSTARKHVSIWYAVYRLHLSLTWRICGISN